MELSSQAAAPRARTSRREILAVFAGLVVMTLAEVAVASASGVARGPRMVALILLAVAKAVLVGLFFMHLRYETRILRLTVFGPLVAPAAYALALVAEAAWGISR
ncbi:cytochrome C oxidase subunit IV family protein [Anaeromyxobacter diazotrophicus]|uniref:Caa(3)-type oxidase, subunit IV n=1 Tax=Anaeromyxobacter diazotrophicus TaxID=2590199 RepID=A0A7I9VK62_9BACT|nr:cytochrome C oxidase subunit IV family protein [Anaeromyxobacter diazotrophicus]GEJ56786.1 hypothetical protein AMYX_15270 [Anaeromyxobacter diazotrophicus]